MNFKLNRVPFPSKKTFPATLWYVCLLALVFPVYLGHFPAQIVSAAQPLVYASSVCAYGILLFKICFRDDFTLSQLLLIGAALMIAAVGTVVSGNRCFLSTFLLVFSAKHINFRKLCRVFFLFFLAMMLLNFLLVAVGVLEDTVLIRGEIINQGAQRHSLGFGHPNSLGFWTVLIVFSALLCCRECSGRYLLCCIAMGFSLCFFLVTDSKAALIASLSAALLCIAAFRLGPWLSSKKWSVPLCMGLFLFGILAFLSLALLYRADSRFFSVCNSLLSDRLAYANAAFRSFGVRLFGAQVNFRWDPVDSLYAYALICLGALPSLAYLGLSLFALYRAARAGRWDIAAVAFAGALYSTMEYGLMNPVHLPLFAALAELEDGAFQKSSL